MCRCTACACPTLPSNVASRTVRLRPFPLHRSRAERDRVCHVVHIRRPHADGHRPTQHVRLEAGAEGGAGEGGGGESDRALFCRNARACRAHVQCVWGACVQAQSVVLNKDLLDVNGDSLRAPGRRVFAQNVTNIQTWAKALANGDQAVVMVNANDFSTLVLTVSWDQVGWPVTANVSVFDMWTHTTQGVFQGSYSATVSAIHALPPARHLCLRRFASSVSRPFLRAIPVRSSRPLNPPSPPPPPPCLQVQPHGNSALRLTLLS